MGSADTPEAEVDVTVDLVGRLLAEQFEELSDRPLRLLASGWDNIIFRLGDDLAVRLPRRHLGAELVASEARWLRDLAPNLPILIPSPLHVGHPSALYPWSWTIVPFVFGSPVGTTPFVDPTDTARRLGEFLAALHQPAPPTAPHNPYRGGPLDARHDLTLQRLESIASGPGGLGAGLDASEVAAAWQECVDVAPWAGRPMWIHGDLHPLNLIQRDGELVSVIDFGDITGGDPATDLLVAWSLFESPERAVFREAAASSTRPIDDAMWERGRGWAITHSLAVLAHSADAPEQAAVARRALAAACATSPKNPNA